MAVDSKKTQAALRDFALSLPGAVEDFPWGDNVVKVNKKIFVFLGNKHSTDSKVQLTVKLPDSGFAALELPNAEPTGYGLGKAGWVSLHFEQDECPPVEYLVPWIEESYRAIAPKKLVAQLDGGPSPIARSTTAGTKPPRPKAPSMSAKKARSKPATKDPTAPRASKSRSKSAAKPARKQSVRKKSST